MAFISKMHFWRKQVDPFSSTQEQFVFIHCLEKGKINKAICEHSPQDREPMLNKHEAILGYFDMGKSLGKDFQKLYI